MIRVWWPEVETEECSDVLNVSPWRHPGFPRLDDGLISWVDEEGNASGWLGHALLDSCLAYMNDVCSNLDTMNAWIGDP